MLTFKLISIIDGVYYYEIYPEGKEEDKGWVKFHPEKDGLIERVEPNTNFHWIGHFFEGIKDKKGNFKESGMVAWY